MLISPANHTSGPPPGQPPLDPSCVVLLVVLAKTLLNILMLVLRRSRPLRFLECFCVSVACVDSVLLASLCTIAHFQDFALWGVRLTKYHLCLFPQVLSFAYGFLPWPVFLLAGLDHYLNVAPPPKVSPRCRSVLYFLSVLCVWAAALGYVLGDPVIYASLSPGRLPAHQCPFYVSVQSYWLAAFLLGVLLAAFGSCWWDVLTLLRSVQVTSLGKEPALYFPPAPDGCRERLLTKLLLCFLGTWLPFVILQMLVLLLDVRVPAYVEVNVPWLYFGNSFLIAAVYWWRSDELTGTESSLHSDPFVSWKFCFIPFTIDEPEPAEKATEVTVC